LSGKKIKIYVCSLIQNLILSVFTEQQPNTFNNTQFCVVFNIFGSYYDFIWISL